MEESENESAGLRMLFMGRLSLGAGGHFRYEIHQDCKQFECQIGGYYHLGMLDQTNGELEDAAAYINKSVS